MSFLYTLWKNIGKFYIFLCPALQVLLLTLYLSLKPDERQTAQQVSSAGMSETSLHLLQPYTTGHQQLQPQHQHHPQNQQVIGMIQQRQMFQHHHHHHQPQHHPQYVIPNGGVLPQAPEAFTPLIPSVVPQGPMLTSSTTSSIQQPQMILMAPQMLPGPSGSHSSYALMAIQHNGNNNVPLHHHHQHDHPGMLRPPPPPPPPPPLPPQSLAQLPSPSSAAAPPLSQLNLLHQGILTIPPHNSSLQMQQQREQQHQQTQQHLTSSGISSVAAIGPEGVLPQHSERGNNEESSSNSNVQGDYVYNNYVVFWEGQV